VASGSLVARFRILRGTLGDGAGIEDGDLEAVLMAFPDGWARRRALSSVIRSGRPETLERALSLIRVLERPWHRKWCASELIRQRDLTPEESEMVRVTVGASR
jgi:hypothetical protein